MRIYGCILSMLVCLSCKDDNGDSDFDADVDAAEVEQQQVASQQQNSTMTEDIEGEESEDALPEGLILAFDSDTCPNGWSEYTPLNGRIVVGAGSGNLDQAGDSLQLRSLGESGGREFTTGFPAYSGSADQQGADAGRVPAAETSEGLMIYGAADGASLSGNVDNSNMAPFVVLTYCQKADEEAGLSSAIIHVDSQDCPGGWDDFSEGQGRFVVGAGSGNTDADGNDLSGRNYLDAGGLEYTSGLAARAAAGTTTTPGPGVTFADDGEGLAMYASSANGSAGGSLADSNLSPYVVVNTCSAANDEQAEELPIDTIAAFDDSCPEGWQLFADGAGRSLLGLGSGNQGADSQALTVRTFASTGGLEYTTALAANTSTGGNNAPSSSTVLGGGYAEGINIFFDGAADTTLYGEKTDSNMQPFYVLNLCEKIE